MKSLLMFIGGLAIGAGVSWVYHKNKYEEMIQEEVEALREHAKSKETHTIVEDTSIEEDLDEDKYTEEELDESMEKAKKIINYSKYSSPQEEDEKPFVDDRFKKPFVVTPDDFASVPGFDTDTFYYHHDNIISNENQEMVDDIENILGLTVDEIRDQFGVFEDDAVYIRNMQLKTDYEILLEHEDFNRGNGDQ